MTCRELTSFIGDYFAGELDSHVRRAFEHHLSVCPNCRQYLADYERTIDVSRAVESPDGDVPDAVPEDLVTAILAARAGRGSS